MGVLDGKVALITGASKGIGLGMATAYAREGAAVMLSSRKQDALDEAARGIEAEVPGARLATFAANAGEPDQAEACVAATIDRLGGIDVLINNAATNPVMGRTIDADLDAWDKTFRVNVRGAARLGPARVAGDDGSERRIGDQHLVGRWHRGNVRDRRLQHHQGRDHPSHEGAGGRDGAAGAGQRNRARAREDRLRPRPVGAGGRRRRASACRCGGSASRTTSLAARCSSPATPPGGSPATCWWSTAAPSSAARRSSV